MVVVAKIEAAFSSNFSAGNGANADCLMASFLCLAPVFQKRDDCEDFEIKTLFSGKVGYKRLVL